MSYDSDFLEHIQEVLDGLSYEITQRKHPSTPVEKPAYERAISYSINDIKWTEMSPTEKGRWQRALAADNKGNASYVKLEQVLKEHSPCFTQGGMGWLLQSGDGIGYRPREWQISKQVNGQ